MPTTTSKVTTLEQLRLQAQRVKQEQAKYALTSALGTLAGKNEVTEAELSQALKAAIDGKMDASQSMTAEDIQQAIAAAIAASGHDIRLFMVVIDVADQGLHYILQSDDSGA